MHKEYLCCICALFWLVLYVQYSYILNTPDDELQTSGMEKKPSFLKDTAEISRPFNKLPLQDFPHHGFLDNKNETTMILDNSSYSVKILPTAEYQSVYLYVTEGGHATLQLRVCDNPKKNVSAGSIIEGWNFLALDYNALIAYSRCPSFAIDVMDLPLLTVRGTANVTVWKANSVIYTKIPIKVPTWIFYSLDVLLAVVLLELYIKVLRTDEMAKRNEMQIAYRQSAFLPSNHI